MSALIQGTHI